ncbi:hypothetical protein SD81_040930 [Tolypothrix campylonemoides VB511288]|nr:hypothetical protein SD81_040930 [Tolypothrix campylonemoides VB511288]
MSNPTLTPLQKAELSSWFDLLEQQWLAAIQRPESAEAIALAEAEAAWEQERQYYHDAYLYSDRC